MKVSFYNLMIFYDFIIYKRFREPFVTFYFEKA